MRVKSRSLGRPPTLWWDLIVWLCFCPLPGGGHDSITSGYKVPCNTFMPHGFGNMVSKVALCRSKESKVDQYDHKVRSGSYHMAQNAITHRMTPYCATCDAIC